MPWNWGRLVGAESLHMGFSLLVTVYEGGSVISLSTRSNGIIHYVRKPISKQFPRGTVGVI
jgi:hypothetical protein